MLNIRTLLRSGAFALLSTAALFAGSAQATVIDFEDIGVNGGVTDLLSNSPYQGLNWNFTLDTVDIGDGSFATPWSSHGPANSGRQAVLNNNGGNGVITGASGAFTFNELWIKSWSSGSRLTTVSGSLLGSQVFSIDININSSIWQVVSAGAALIDTLIISPSNGIFLIDDVAINHVFDSVPAPGALLLLGLGLIGLGLKRKAA